MPRLDGRPSRAALGALLCAFCVGACSDEDAGDAGSGGAGGLGAMTGGGSSGSSGGSGRGGNGSGGTAGGPLTGGAGVGAAGIASVAGEGGSGAGRGGAGASGAGGSGSAGEPTPESLFPLAVGNRWTYLVTTTLPDSSPCPAGEHSTELVSSSTVDGRMAFEAKHVCDALMPEAVRFYAYSELGVETKRCAAGAAGCGPNWVIGLPRPVAEQATFQALDGLRTVHRVGRVTVPAGTFEECWETRGESPSPLVSVYCPGVGAVAFSQMDETSPPSVDYALELTSFDVQ